MLGNITGSSRSIFGCFTNSNLELEFHVWRISRPTNWKVKHWILRSTKPASAPTHTREAEFSFSWPPRALKIEFNKLKKYSTTYNDTHTLTKLQIGQGGVGVRRMLGQLSGPIFTFQFSKHTHTHTSLLPLVSHFSFLNSHSHLTFRCILENLRPAIRNPWDDVRLCQKGANPSTVFPHCPYVIVLCSQHPYTFLSLCPAIGRNSLASTIRGVGKRE